MLLHGACAHGNKGVYTEPHRAENRLLKSSCFSCSFNMATHEEVRFEIVMPMFEKSNCLPGK